jgi:hypothetical protein
VNFSKSATKLEGLYCKLQGIKRGVKLRMKKRISLLLILALARLFNRFTQLLHLQFANSPTGNKSPIVEKPSNFANQ